MEDQEAIARVLAGDVDAFAVLVQRHRDKAFTLALRIVRNREEAEEIAQDSFVKAYRALASFRKEAKFSTWLYRIVYNMALSRLRRRRPEPAAGGPDEIAFGGDVDPAGALARLAARDRRRFVGEAMSRLDPRDAAVITLHYFEEAGVEEISGTTGLSQSNVKVRLHRARKKLQAELQNMLKGEARSLVGAG
jgi:RNA polymerase sigma-70 factor (ECF subfamily)